MNSLNNKSFFIKDIIEKGDRGDGFEEEEEGNGENDELEVGVMEKVQEEVEEEEEVGSLSSGVYVLCLKKSFEVVILV